MILLINLCKEKLHYYEFVKPIEDILKRNKISFFTKHYKQINEIDLKKSDKIIICGTSLKDFGYINDFDRFNWIKNFEKPLLVICGGMQIVGKIWGSRMRDKMEIGFYTESFVENFLGMIGEKEVYHLHNQYTIFPRDFTEFTKSEIPQAVKHKTKEIYGVLFHPEVRNKEIILNFANN